MQGIINKRASEYNIGAVRDLLFIPIEYVTSLGLMTDGAYDVNAIPTLTGEWYRVDFVRESCRMLQEHANGVNGPFVKQTVSFAIARNNDARWAQLKDMREREYMVLVIDNNNKGYLIGEISVNNEKRGARLFVKTDTGAKYTERNDLEYYFYMEAFDYACNATYTTPVTIHTDSPDESTPLPPVD